jgi:hypothetical protein
MRAPGPMHTAFISLATCSPRRTPAVIAFADDAGQTLFDDDLSLDVRIFRQRFHELWPQNRIGGVLGGRDPNRAGRLIPKFA